MVERYVSNPRHKAPWQPGARGTQCPRDVDGEKLFGTATADPRNPRKKYNADGTAPTAPTQITSRTRQVMPSGMDFR